MPISLNARFTITCSVLCPLKVTGIITPIHSKQVVVSGGRGRDTIVPVVLQILFA